MHQLKAIIFDVDGTLANTEETHRRAFNAAFNEFKLDFSWSEQEYAKLLCISGGRERIHAFLKSLDFDPKGDISLRELSRRIHIRKSEIYRDKLVRGHVGLRSGVRRLLDDARERNIRLGIATATSTANVETLLFAELGRSALSRFDVVVTSDIVADKKPSPIVYQFAMAELGLIPEECIAVEDTSNGNRSAIAAGMKTVITTHSFTSDDDFNGASLVLNQLGDPGDPFTVEAGIAGDSTFVDTVLLERLLNQDTTEKETEAWEEFPVIVAK